MSIKIKDKKKFIKLVNELKVHKNTIIFKTNIFKLMNKRPKLMSSVTLDFYKDIKQIYNENLNEFEKLKVICFKNKF